MRNQLLERIKFIASKLAGSQAILGDILGINRRTFEGYLKKERENSLWPLLPQILEMYPQIQRNWLYFGEGAPYLDDVQPQQFEESVVGFSPQNALRPVPMVGFASCGTEGWNTVTSISVSASPIMLGKNSIAVIAAGESMVPAGIACGQICYCDPDQVPLEGDVVYLLRQDNTATVKVYLGPTEKYGWIGLQGWLDQDEAGERKSFSVDIPEDEVALIAPVLYVRRRL